MCFTQVSLWICIVLSATGSGETVMICQIPNIYTTYNLERSSKILSQHFSFPPRVWCQRKMAAVWTCSTDICPSCKPAAGLLFPLWLRHVSPETTILTDDAVLFVQQRGVVWDAGLLSSCPGWAGPARLSGRGHEGGGGGGGGVLRGH